MISASRHPPPTVPIRAPPAATSSLAVALIGSDPCRLATDASAAAPAPDEPAAMRAHSARISGRLMDEVLPYRPVHARWSRPAIASRPPAPPSARANRGA